MAAVGYVGSVGLLGLARRLLSSVSLPLDNLTSAAAYSTRKLRTAYTGPALRVRRSSDNAEANIGFATVPQTRTNLAPVPAASRDSRTVAGIALTTEGTGTEYGQSYVDVRWAGTATTNGNLQYGDSVLTSGPNSTSSALVTPGETYTCSLGYRVVAGTFPTFTVVRLAPTYRNNASFVSSTNVNLTSLPNATLQRASVTTIAPATANYVQNTFQMTGVTAGFACDFTLRFYAPNTELGVGNVRPLVQRYVAETIAGIGDLDAETLLAFDSSENLFLHSEAFDNAYWTTVRSTAVPNALAAPNATMTADFVRENTEFGAHVLLRSETVVASTLYTFSVYVAKFGALNSRRWAYFSAVTNTANATRHTILVDLQAGTVIETRQLGSPVGGASSVTDAGNFWRVSVSMRSEGTGFLSIFGAADSATPSWTPTNDVIYTGNDVSGVYFWGAQLNLGPVALPYTRTTTTTQTFNINTTTFVATWHDQSGNARNMTQTTAASQPNLVSLGVINTVNGRPSVRTDGAQFIQADFGLGTIAQPFTRSYVITRLDNVAVGSNAHYISNFNSTPNTTEYGVNATTMNMYAGGTPHAQTLHNFVMNETGVFTAVYNNSVGNTLAKNGVTLTAPVNHPSATLGLSGARIGANNAFPTTGLFGASEYIVQFGVISAPDRQSLVTNQTTYYGIV